MITIIEKRDRNASGELLICRGCIAFGRLSPTVSGVGDCHGDFKWGAENW